MELRYSGSKKKALWLVVIQFIMYRSVCVKLTTFLSADIIYKESMIYKKQEVKFFGRKKRMPLEQELSDLADFFKVFGDATRLKIMQVLLENEMCVYDIAQMLNMTQSAISHQLRILKQMALVKNRRDGKVMFYSLADDHIITILSQGLVHIREDD